MNDGILFNCPQCNHLMRVPSSLDGKKGECPECSETITITLPADGKVADAIQGEPISEPIPAGLSTDQPELLAQSAFENTVNQPALSNPAMFPVTSLPVPVYQHPYRRMAPRPLGYAPGSILKLSFQLKLVIGWIVGVLVLGSVAIVGGTGDQNAGSAEMAAIIIGLILIALILCAGITQMMLLYRYWNILQDPYPSTKPARAVGFLFIPLFNMYWTYVAIVGLAKQTNDYCDEVGIGGVKINENQALWLYVTWLLSFIPVINFLTSILFVFLVVLVNGQLARKAEDIMHRHREVQVGARG